MAVWNILSNVRNGRLTQGIPDSPFIHGSWSVEAARSTTPLILFDDLSVVIYRCLRHAYTFF